MESERGRLERLYAEMGDEHLRDLAEEQDDLTDEARTVLLTELRRRGMAAPVPEAQPIEATVERERETGFGPGIPGMFPASAAVVEQALEASRPSKDGLSSLISFYDGMQLSKACAALEEAEMEPVIEPVAGDAMSGVPPRYEVWLDSRDIEPAKTLLRRTMGLFPLQEVEGEDDAEAEATGLVGVFETEGEAEAVQRMLNDAGFAARLEQDDEFGEWEVSVAPEEQERAVGVVAKGMGMG